MKKVSIVVAVLSTVQVTGCQCDWKDASEPTAESPFSVEIEYLERNGEQDRVVKSLIIDHQGVKEVGEWLMNHFRMPDRHGDYSVSPHAVLFISIPGDMQFESIPANRIDLYAHFKGFEKWIRDEEFASLFDIFRKY